MRPRISIRGLVRPSVGRSVRPSVTRYFLMMRKWPKWCNKLGNVLVTLSNASLGNSRQLWATLGQLLGNSGTHLWANSWPCSKENKIFQEFVFLFLVSCLVYKLQDLGLVSRFCQLKDSGVLQLFVWKIEIVLHSKGIDPLLFLKVFQFFQGWICGWKCLNQCLVPSSGQWGKNWFCCAIFHLNYEKNTKSINSWLRSVSDGWSVLRIDYFIPK